MANYRYWGEATQSDPIMGGVYRVDMDQLTAWTLSAETGDWIELGEEFWPDIAEMTTGRNPDARPIPVDAVEARVAEIKKRL